MRCDAAISIIKRHLNDHVEAKYRILNLTVKYKGTAKRQLNIEMKSDIM